MATLRSIFALATLLGAAPLGAQAALDANQREARDILRQLVNINSTTGTPGVKRAAEAMAQRFRLAGFSAADVRLLGPTPALTGLVVRYRGRAGSGTRPIVLMAHLDVVPARRADWPFDPFVLQEKDGWYYGRGAEDDKAGVASIVATLLRFKREKYVPERDLVAVLTADEETDGRSIQWLLANHRALIDGEYALNADAGNVNLEQGKALTHTLQASEKVFANFKVEATNPGGHSSLPRKDNAIYDLSMALAKLAVFDFPVRLNEVSRAYFRQSAAAQPADVAALMIAVADNPAGPATAQLAAKNPYWNSVLRTTCVATLLSGGHADNALPQRAAANVNCRMLPDDPTDSVRTTLQRVMGSAVKVTVDGTVTNSPVSPLRSDLMGVVDRLTRTRFPGATVVPEMSAGATDGLFMRNAGIPTYGLTAIAFEQSEPSRAHGQEERVGVNAFHAAVRFWYEMVKSLTTPSVTP